MGVLVEIFGISNSTAYAWKHNFKENNMHKYDNDKNRKKKL